MRVYPISEIQSNDVSRTNESRSWLFDSYIVICFALKSSASNGFATASIDLPRANEILTEAPDGRFALR